MMFIDLKKTHNKALREILWRCLYTKVVPLAYIRVMRDIFNGVETSVRSTQRQFLSFSIFKVDFVFLFFFKIPPFSFSSLNPLPCSISPLPQPPIPLPLPSTSILLALTCLLIMLPPLEENC